MSQRTGKRQTASRNRSESPTQQARNGGDAPNGQEDRPQSPLGSHLMSRIQEKEQLKGLNDRLAAYIDRVRSLESENARLSIQISSSQETVSREVTSIKTMFQKELGETRRVLDMESREKAKAKIENEKLRKDVDEFQVKLSKREKDVGTLEKRLGQAEEEMEQLRSKVNSSNGSMRRLEEDLKEMTSDRDKLAKSAAQLRERLDKESLERANLENRVTALQEELTFSAQLHSQEMEESRSASQMELSQVVTEGLQQQYQEKLTDELHALRADYEQQLEHCRAEFNAKYDRELTGLQKQLEIKNAAGIEVRNEIKTLRARNDSLTSQLSSLESTNHALNQRVNDLQSLLAQEREWHEDALRNKEEELTKLRADIAQQISEYQELLEIKMSLDLEINAYRKLLEGEESRLNLSANSSANLSTLSSTSASASSSSRPKRKRIIEQEEENVIDVVVNSDAKGDVEINEQDPDGKFVRVYNKGDKDVSLGGWQLVRNAGPNKLTHFKFHRSVVIKPKSEVTIWSADSNVAHNPPADIVMKGSSWLVSDSMTTSLMSAEGEEMAARHTCKKKRSTIAHRRSGHLSASGEVNGQDRCALM